VNREQALNKTVISEALGKEILLLGGTECWTQLKTVLPAEQYETLWSRWQAGKKHEESLKHSGN
jgi:hypothetical protein